MVTEQVLLLGERDVGSAVEQIGLNHVAHGIEQTVEVVRLIDAVDQCRILSILLEAVGVVGDQGGSPLIRQRGTLICKQRLGGSLLDLHVLANIVLQLREEEAVVVNGPVDGVVLPGHGDRQAGAAEEGVAAVLLGLLGPVREGSVYVLRHGKLINGTRSRRLALIGLCERSGNTRQLGSNRIRVSAEHFAVLCGGHISLLEKLCLDVLVSLSVSKVVDARHVGLSEIEVVADLLRSRHVLDADIDIVCAVLIVNQDFGSQITSIHPVLDNLVDLIV